VSSVMPTSDTSTAYARAWQVRARRFTLRRLVRLFTFVALGFGIGIAGFLTVPMAFGYRGFVVLSGSMAPAIGTGDAVLVDSISPLQARIGDVVTFRSPEDPARMITHRVVSMRASGNLVQFVTKGDANTGVERWSVPADGAIGRVQYRVPKLGYITNRLGSRFGRFAFLVVPALLLGVMEVRRIWSPAKKGPGDELRR
jgi:signal peptidase